MPRIPSHEVFVQTPRGAAAAAGQPADLSERLRTLLFLINGRRRMSEYRDLLPRYRNIDGIFELLTRKGYIEPLVERNGNGRTAAERAGSGRDPGARDGQPPINQ